MRNTASLKNKTLALALSWITCGAIPSTAADAKATQQISMPTAAEVIAKLSHPSPDYGPTATWGWDGPMSEEAITRDIEGLHKKGFRMVTLEAGYNMEKNAPYLSEEWFAFVKHAVAEAKARNMRVLIIDEGKYPSGFAGGLFSQKRPDLRMHGIAIFDTIEVQDGEPFSRKVGPEVVGALAVNAEDGSHIRLDTSDGSINWPATDGEWKIHLVNHDFRTPNTRAVNDPTRAKTRENSMGDLLSREAVQQFIDWTHEAYKKHVGDEFGKTIIGFRGDEPDFASLPYTPGIFDIFEQSKGYDIRSYLSTSVRLPSAGGDQNGSRGIQRSDEERRAMADYYDVWSKLFADNFFGMQAEWCAANGIEHTTHLNNEHRMERLIPSTGDFFRAMRHVQIPGVDSIWNQVWPGRNADFVKLPASAAHMYGRPKVLSESYAAYNNPRPPNLEEALWGANYQLVRGITLFEFMFVPSSAQRGELRFSNYLGEEGFAGMAEYVNRAGFVLSQGKPTAKIGIYFPTTSMWLGDYESNETAMAIAESLLKNQRDFDFVDEQGLGSEFTLKDGKFTNLSGSDYQAIVLPSITAISKPSLDRLREFSRQGGTVVSIGKSPSMVVENSFLEAKSPSDLSWMKHEPAGELTQSVLSALPHSDVVLDKPATSVTYFHKELADADLYFFFNEGKESVSRKATLEGSGTVQTWDLQTGKVASATGAKSTRESTTLPLFLKGGESKLIAIIR